MITTTCQDSKGSVRRLRLQLDGERPFRACAKIMIMMTTENTLAVRLVSGSSRMSCRRTRQFVFWASIARFFQAKCLAE